jgi:hypothetical protein
MASKASFGSDYPQEILAQPTFERLALVEVWRSSSNSQKLAYQLAYSATLFCE